MTVKVQPLSWGQIDALKDGDPLYVVNNSDMGRKQSRGEVHLAVIDNDHEVQVPIPNTWIPINLVEHVTLRALKASNTLRILLRGQVLVAISEREANVLLDSANGRQEADRVRGIMAANVSSMIGIQSGAISIDTSSGGKVADPATPATSTGGPSTTIATRIVDEYNNGGDEHELIERLNMEVEGGRVDRQDMLTAMDNLLNKGSKLFLALSDLAQGEAPGGGQGGNVVRAM